MPSLSPIRSQQKMIQGIIESFVGPGTYEASSDYLSKLKRQQLLSKAIGATKPKGVVKIGRNLIQPLDDSNPSQAALQRYKAL
jgi:hypothetical protein